MLADYSPSLDLMCQPAIWHSTRPISPVVLDASLSVKDLQEFHGLIDEFGKAYRDDAAKASPFWVDGGLDCTANRSQ